MTDQAASRFVVHHGDNMAILPTLADCSVDAIVTDPPAGISFMGRAWDSDKGGRDAWIAWLSGVMGECLRVLKPGGHALVWAIPRTSHWTGMAIENAGFEIRDRVAHCFGSGFPKSLDVSKAIDKHGGQSVAWFGPWLRGWREANGVTQKEVAALFPSKTGGLTGCVANWELGLNMPTPDQFNAIRERYALPFESLEVLAREVIMQSAGTRLAVAPGQGEDRGAVTIDITAPATAAARQWQGWGTALKPAIEDWWLARKPLSGTVAANVLAHGTGALNIDACRIGTDGGGTQCGNRDASGKCLGHKNAGRSTSGETFHGPETEGGRWPANLIHSGEPEVLAAFPQGSVNKAGVFASSQPAGWAGGTNNIGCTGIATRDVFGYGDTGSAARFFMQCPPDEATSLYFKECTWQNHQSNVPTAVLILSLRSALAVIVQNVAAIWPSLAGVLSEKNLTEPSINVTPSAFETLRDCVINAIQNLESNRLHETKQEKRSPCNSLVKVVVIREPTGTTMITASLLSLDGSVDHVTFSITSASVDRGEVVSRLKYTPKASRSDRDKGNTHSTVKPIALMRYLCRLITPPGGVVLDVFCGSGSTGQAAMFEGFRFIGIEQDAGHVELARHRIGLAARNGWQAGLELETSA